MKYIGAHVSTESGVCQAPGNAHAIGAKAFALFTRNPSRWASKAISDAEAEEFKRLCAQYGYSPEVILPHDSFLINLGSPEEDKLAKSRKAFADELHRCEQLGLTMLNFHPGSHMRIFSEEDCLKRIAESMNLALEASKGVKAVIENTAGQGSNLGFSFEQLARIIEQVDDKERVGVCIDTCHAHAAGYDMLSEASYDATWREFDDIVGFRYLSGMHLNGTEKSLGSRVDRHSPLKVGELKEDFWHRLMNDPRMDGIPLILETTDERLWPEEISWLYSLIEAK